MAAPWLWVPPLGSHVVKDITLRNHQTQVQEHGGRGFAPGRRPRGPFPSAELGSAGGHRPTAGLPSQPFPVPS